MQTINHEHKNINPIFDDIERFYKMASEKKQNTLVPMVYDVSFQPLLELFNQFGETEYSVEFKKKQYNKIQLDNYDPKNIIVCFSGGKDSLSAVLHYQKLGYNVYLYHITGLNKVYYDEYKAVKKLSEKLNLPLYLEDVTYTGQHEWIEHPMKNMLMLNLALQFGIREKIGVKIATGNFYTSTVYLDSFDVCGGDCIEMWRAYEGIIKKVIPKFHVYVSSKNFQSTINSLLKKPELIPDVISCMTPNRFREQLRKKNQIKYGFPVLENRCGSCWKCCIEYIIMADNDLIKYDESYYKHCLDILRNTTKKESGEILYTIDDIWNRWLFYDRRKSKYMI